MNKLKNDKGVTMIALIISIIIMAILLTVVNFGSESGLEMRNLNNMYADILILEEKISLYYLEHGEIPITGTNLPIVNEEILKNNPNNNELFYAIDMSKLDNITLYNMKDQRNSSDRYIINAQSHTVYYQKGVRIDDKSYYTIPEDYQKIDLSLYQ